MGKTNVAKNKMPGSRHCCTNRPVVLAALLLISLGMIVLMANPNHVATIHSHVFDDRGGGPFRSGQAMQARPSWLQIAGEGDPKRLRRDAPKTVGGMHRIVLASIPRTGNGWIRGLIEGATGVASESIFKEGPASHFHERSGGYGKRCGWLDDCSMVGLSVGIDPVVIKTHFPFTSQVNVEEYLSQKRSDVGDASYIISPVRNPLDNYEAWSRYQTERLDNKTWTHVSLKDFMAAWVEHHSYWYDLGIPMFIYRYEDLVDNPIAMLKQILLASGMWDFFKLDDVNLIRVAGVDRLQAYKRKQFGAPTRQKDDMAHNYQKYRKEDIEWVLATYRPILKRYGYDTVYDLWLEAHKGEMTEDEIISAVQKAMLQTAAQANRGDVYSIDQSYFSL